MKVKQTSDDEIILPFNTLLNTVLPTEVSICKLSVANILMVVNFRKTL